MTNIQTNSLTQSLAKLATLAVLAFASTMSFAGILTVNGDTTGDPTFNRPIANGNLVPGSLSGVGTAVRFEVTAFNVNATGNYSFFNATGYDSYLSIYQTAFNPAAGLTNGVASSDDFNGTLDGGFAALSLMTGVNYFAVSSGFDNSDFGAFRLTITGNGDNTAFLTNGNNDVPEPTSLALLGLGLIGLAAARRRKSA